MFIMAEVIMNFTSETKVKDIALSNPASRKVLEDAGLDYCCGVDLHAACTSAATGSPAAIRVHESSASD